jgi:LysM repeat protein
MLAAIVRLRTLSCLTLAALLASGCVPERNGEQDPKRDADYLRGQNLLSQLDYEGAARAFHRALASNPRSAAAHFELGFLCKDRVEDPAAAIFHFQKFLSLSPESDQAGLIRRHIDNCKMELAKLFLIAPVVPDAQRELDRLKDVVKELQSENESLRHELANSRQPQPAAPPEPEPVPTLPTVAPPRREPVQGMGRGMLASTPLPVPVHEASVPAVENVVYTIRDGDYPAKIARKHGVKLEALLKANPGLNPRRLKIGEKVTIPTG